MKLAPALAAIAVSLATSACAQALAEPISTPAAPVSTAATDRGSPAYPMTPEGAAQFVAAVEKDLADFTVQAGRVAWVNNTYITEDTDALNARIGAEGTEKTVRYALDAARYVPDAEVSP